MTVSPGLRFGPYEILAQVGAGGMGEVYRARDTRLERTVAIKVLSADVAQNPEFRRRLEREARIISNLNHPNICILYDIGIDNGLDYLVMEFLDGETLQSRLHRGPLPADILLPLSIQITDALALAHRNTVFHRDLKPSNIMLTGPRHRPIAKLLDFGLAKTFPVRTPDPVGPTVSHLLTQHGVILGTVPYMAPEQLEGKPLDARTDIFSFGAVLYEMATGRHAFSGGSQASIIASVLREDPPPLPAPPASGSLPRPLNRVLQRCLTKDPDERWQSAHDLAEELRWISQDSGFLAVADRPSSRASTARLLRIAVLALLALSLLLGIALFIQSRRGAAPLTLASALLPPPKTIFDYFALSPDGRWFAFLGRNEADGVEHLWIRNLSSGENRLAPGTEDAGFPFWSPDSRFVAYFASDRTLKRIPVQGGVAQTITEAADPRGGSWGPNGVIVFAPSAIGPLHQVSAAGGPSTPVTSFDRPHYANSHRWPQFLPGGRRFLYTRIGGDPAGEGIFVQSLDTSDRKRLLPIKAAVVYAHPGYLLWARDGVLQAQRFDLDRLELAESPIPLARPILDAEYRLAVAASENGTLTWRLGEVTSVSRLGWFDRKGQLLEWIGPIGHQRCPELSPDGSRVVWERRDAQSRTYDLYLMDLLSRVPSRFTFDPADDSNAAWSPDSNWILFTSNRRGSADLYRKHAAGTGEEQTVFHSPVGKNLDQWSADGRFAVYSRPIRAGVNDLYAVSLFAPSPAPFPLATGPANEVQGRISPNGRWLAYASEESGVLEVYVRPFAPADDEAHTGKWQVSSGGGAQPRWSRDGKELFYLSAAHKLVAARVSTDTPRFQVLGSQALFQTGVTSLADARNHYSVSADSQRFLINVRAEEEISHAVHLLLNWTARLQR